MAAWSLAGYFSFRDGVKEANKRLPAAAERQLSGQGGLVLTKPTTILLLGTDAAPGEARRGLRHSDSMMLVRTDPDLHRIYYLSIPRDLRVEIPGYGTDRINTAYQVGGAPLAIRTVASYTGIPIDHVAVVDFQRFKELIDSIGGIDITVPQAHPVQPLRVPVRRDGLRELGRLALRQGAPAHGRAARARLLAHPREPARPVGQRHHARRAAAAGDAGDRRQARQRRDVPTHAVLGDELLRPLATDLSANQLLQLGWVKFRVGNTIRCRLGGDLARRSAARR